MTRLVLLLLLFGSFSLQAKEPVFLFSYFTDNGQDGIHFAYSRNGLNWEKLNDGKSYLVPTVGKDKLMRDPFILQGEDGIFHLVWTTSWKDREIGYASSKDLIHWSDQKAIPVMANEPDAKNCWAPEIVYDRQNKDYIIFWATTIPGKHSQISESGNEKGMNHRIYATRTKDFKTFSSTYLFFDPNFSVIDSSILYYKGTYYHFLKNENPNPPEKNIRITSSPNATGPYPTTVSDPITGKYWAEGPSPLMIGKQVYVYFDKYTQHKYGVIRSSNFKDWEDLSDQLTMPAGVRHGCAFQVKEKVLRKLLSPNVD